MTDLSPDPVAIWDVGQPGWYSRMLEPRAAWLEKRGLPASVMYRAEFYADPPRVKVFCFALNGDGRKYQVHPPGQCTPGAHGPQCIAREEPRMVPLPDLPPAELR